MTAPAFVSVPKSELERLEQARLELYRLLGNPDTGTLVRWSKVTDAMWEIANRKWPEAAAPAAAAAPPAAADEARDAKDAARYRWLRESSFADWQPHVVYHNPDMGDDFTLSGEKLDISVDAAMTKAPPC